MAQRTAVLGAVASGRSSVASDCDVCHIGNDKLPVYLNSSSGGDGFAPVGCMGCHGVNPAPNVPNNNWWGAGHGFSLLPFRR